VTPGSPRGEPHSRLERLSRRRAARNRSFLALLLVGAGSATIAYPALAYGTGALRQARLAAEVRTLLGPDPPPGPVSSETTQTSAIEKKPSPKQPATKAAAPDRPAPARPSEGDALGIVEVPSVGISVVFLEGVSDQTLLTGPGHLPWTALPGSADVSVLAGHRDMHFRNLKDVSIGSRIVLRLPKETITYRVTDRAIALPDAAWVTAPRSAPTLRLVTCWPPNFIGHAPERLVVTATPVPPRGPSVLSESNGGLAQIAGGDGDDSEAVVSRFDQRAEEPLKVSATVGDLVPAGALPPIGAVGAAVAGVAAAGAWLTRRRLLLWLLPWVVGVVLNGVVLLAAWGGPGILAAH
jgi:sortase A